MKGRQTRESSLPILKITNYAGGRRARHRRPCHHRSGIERGTGRPPSRRSKERIHAKMRPLASFARQRKQTLTVCRNRPRSQNLSQPSFVAGRNQCPQSPTTTSGYALVSAGGHWDSRPTYPTLWETAHSLLQTMRDDSSLMGSLLCFGR